MRIKLFLPVDMVHSGGWTNDVLPEELFQELIPDVTHFDYSWDIVCDSDKSEKVGKALENLVVSHTDIGLDTFEDRVDSFGYMSVVYGIMQVISWFIFLFGD